ncbi:MAG: hypothetical protein ACKVOU_07010 [Cytophagales bacterium]
MKIAGIFLLVLGLVMASFTGFDLVTKKKVVDIGSVEISADEKTPIYWSPITGVLLAVAGVALIVIYKDK